MNAATALSAVLADEFARCGVADVVVAPGARSGPLAQALFLEARRSGQRLHTRFDERTAGFLALGLAKRSGRPVVVVCTSGTATANLHPAVLEASHSHLPLVIVTADRPPEMRGTGASQTTDQIKLFGSAVRLFVEIGTPEEHSTPSANTYWRSLVCRALASAADGPVHLNVPLREPLEFTPTDDCRFAGRPGGKRWIEIEPAGRQGLSDSPIAISAATRGVMVVGDDAVDPDAAVAVAEALGWPVLAEPQSNARRGPNAITTYRYLLAHPDTRRRLLPELVVSVGRPGISREIQALLRDMGEQAEHIVVDPHDDWADPTRTAHRRLRRLPTPEGDGDATWLRLWQAADETARAALDGFLDDSDFSEPRLVRDVLRHLPEGALCVIGSSMPIRDAEVTMPPRRGLRVLCNRGLAGIDGTTSTAIGAAIAHQAAGGGKAYALMGDLTFLHDLTGLIGGPGTAAPDLTVIVVNNQGGGIFSLVGHTADAVGFDDLFATPHTVDIASLAAGMGWQHDTVNSPSQLTASLAGAGPRIVEVRTDRNANAKLHQRLSDHISRALDSGGIR
ncbi:2-succinyl-5-enolpyruvyl-6-hydroxy-3-cyclohexene-1-carboxylic-acid synthase [Mycobacterium sp.]|uniref:2-succinyl-5-enolpyruvyl-6-hydroxy-3- cyclohexene-1-carboxylic-acid synthase n=1 Tax=Mycobacterium sp. TaxID=1785 RepID=UPI003C777F89